jgi:hypothetical protein
MVRVLVKNQVSENLCAEWLPGGPQSKPSAKMATKPILNLGYTDCIDWETSCWCCMLFQESLPNVLLDLVLAFSSDEACLKLNEKF